MENIAHTLCGLRIADLGFRARIGPRAPWIAAIAANLPDADLVLAAWGSDTYLWWHRGLTHSVFGWPVLAVAGATISQRWTRKGSWREHFTLWFAALASHVLFDIPTTWGTMLLLPATDRRFDLDWIFIVDPMFWVILGLLPRWIGAARALWLMAGWIGFCGVVHAIVEARVPGVHAYPAPLAPIWWTGVREQDGALHRYWLTPVSTEAGGTFDVPDGPAIDALRSTWKGDRYFWMAREPALRDSVQTSDGATELTLSDLAFTNRFSPEDFRFTTVFTVDDGKVIAVER